MLTNERLKKLSEMRITELIDNITFGDLKEIVSELLAIREAGGNEGIKALRYKVDSAAPESSEESAALDALENAAITLGQQLREAQAEIERLKRENDTIKGYFPKGAFEAKPQHEDGGGGYYDLLPGGLDQ